jgi:hypothetical protein
VLFYVAPKSLDIHRPQVFMSVLEFKLHPVTYPQIVDVATVCPGILEVHFISVFRQNATQTTS